MKMKRILSAFLVLLCLLTAFSLGTLGASAAEGTRTVYATTNASAKQGSYGYLYVYLDDLTDLSALNVSVYYDAEKITVKSVTNRVSSVVNDLATADGQVNASYIFDGKGKAEKTNLFYIYYQVNTTAEVGDTYFDIVVNEAYNSSLEGIDFTGSRCSLEITETTVTKSCSIYSTSTVSTSVGEEFELNYRLSTYQIASGSMNIQYDPELFEVVSATSGGFLNGKIADVNTALDGSIAISFVGTDYQYNSDIITVRFKTIKNVSETSDIKLVVTDLYDKELNLYSCSGYTTKANIAFDETYTEDAPSMSVSSSYNAETGKVTATIKLKKDSMLGAGDFVLTFDYNKFTYESAEKGFSPTFFNVNDKQAEEGVIKFSIISMTDITAEEIVLIVTFDCPVFCEDLTTEFGITGSGVTDSMVNPIVLNFIDSTLDIFGIGHNMTDATCTEASTCQNEGCNHTVGAALGHDMTEPTCTEASRCQREGCNYIDGDALGHRVLVDGRVWVDSIVFENDATYPFELNEGIYSSTNKNHSTESIFTITALYDCTLTISYSVSSEQNYDKLIVRKNGTQMYQISGQVDWTSVELHLDEGDVVTISYRKDGSVSRDQDTGWFSFTCTQTEVGELVPGPAEDKEPTCTEAVVCYFCQTVVKEALGHEYDDWIVIKAPNCTEIGTDEHECTVCHHKETKTTNALGHTEKEAVIENRVEPTCTVKGSYDSVTYCYVCSEELSREVKSIEKLGHNYETEWTTDIEPTCTTTGSKSHHCSRCDDKADITPIPANGHSYGDWYVIKAPTCTLTGTDEHVCSVCQYTETRTTNALGHTSSAAVVENLVLPNCTDNGGYDSVVYCSVCNAELSRVVQTIAKLGHDYKTEWTTDIEPTCITAGSKSHHCTRCDDKTDITPIPANGHSYGDWYEINAPTCTVTGTDEHKCYICQYTETRTTNALGHTEGEAVVENRVEPTCTVKGSYDSVIYCSVCDAELSREVKSIEKLGHNYETKWTTDIEPTCITAGSKSHHCTRCDDKTDITPIPANGHSYGDWYVIIAPTCTATGTDEHKCSVCQHTETKTTNAFGHTESAAVVEKLVLPNCMTNGGYDSVIYCSVCDEELSRVAQTIDKLGHDYKTEWTTDLEPTCTVAGSKSHHCTRCDDKANITPIPANGHYFGDWYEIKAPTCTATGTDKHKCSVCQHTETRTTNALGHTEKAAVVENRVEATCTVNGSYDSVVYCSVCDAELSREAKSIEKLGHNYSEEWETDLEATCITAGSKSRHCTRCDDKADVTSIPANGHAYGDWYTTKEPTESEQGEKRRDCSNCDHYETSAIAVLDHSHDRWETIILEAKNPTCTLSGLTQGSKCSKCGEILIAQNYIPANGHSYGDWYEIKASTCTTTGTDEHKCSVCQHTETRTVEALGHNYSEEWTTDVLPTCTTEGSKSRHCTRCDDKTDITSILASGHTYGEWYETKAPTCTATGTDEHECSVCHNKETRTTDALGHTNAMAVVENKVDATCTTDGSYDSVVYCSVCEVELSREIKIIEKLGHNYSVEWTIDTAPTCTTEGSKSHHCTRCGDKADATPIPMSDHAYGDWYVIKIPTCIETGTEEHKCSVCQHTETRIVKALGHTNSAAIVENKVDATCTIDGSYDSVVYCSVCEVELSREIKIIEKLGHNYSEEWKTDLEATCTVAGSKSHHCTRCDDKADITPIPANGHSYGDWYEINAPTCTVTGADEHKCTICQHTETRTTNALGHTDKEAVIDNRVEPTCTVNGSYDSVVYCSVCDAELSREAKSIEKLGHNYESEWTTDSEPTCITAGSKSHHCTRCDDKADITPIPANGHSYGDWYEIKAPTCTETGTDEHECIVCHHKETKTTNALGHTENKAAVENYVEPTCTVNGSYDSVVYCSVCDAELSREAKSIENLGHNYETRWTTDVEPTCTTVGSKSHHCTRCDDKADVTEIPASGHVLSKATIENNLDPTCTTAGSYDNVIYCVVCEAEVSRETIIVGALGHVEIIDAYIAPTCTETGLAEGKHCSVCNKVLVVQEVIDALGHLFAHYTFNNDATCTDNGTETAKCDRCDEIDTRIAVDSAIGHIYGIEVVENNVDPSCTADGSYDNVVYCSECSVELSREKIIVEAIGHSYGSWYDVTAPNCTEDGLERRDCAKCDAFETNVLSKLGHSYDYVTIDPTCTNHGYTTYICHCGDSYVDAYVDALGHTESDIVVENEVDPTCAVDGSYDNVIYCTVCDAELSRETITIDALGHDYQTTWSSNSTLHWYECSCGEKQNVEKHVFDNACDVDCNKCGFTRSTKHSFDQGVITREPTTTEEGRKTYTCTVCGEKKYEDIDKLDEPEPSGGCYIATSVYGSYDCPEVWTLRRFRDNVLAKTWLGRAFVKTYYAVSPTLVEWFGETNWFQNIWRAVLDVFVDILNGFGFESTPYHDQKW